MNEEPNNNVPDPAVAGVEAALDRLANADRSGARPALEDRIVAATRRVLAPLPSDIARVGERVDDLAAREQLSASRGMEDGAFELSREAVASGRFTDQPALRLTGDAPEPVVVVRRVRTGTLWRIAAAVGIVGGAGVVTALMMRGSGPQATRTIAGAPSTEELAANISTEMDLVFATLDADYSSAMSDESGGESDLDTSWVEEMFARESL